MPLTQVLDPFGEPLDLWLSPNHEGQRRYVDPSELAESAEARDVAGTSGEGATDPNEVVLCEPVSEDDAGASRVPLWLRAGADTDVEPVRASTGRVPAPSPRRSRSSGDRASSSLGAGAAPPRPSDADMTYDPRFNNESGVPTVFVTRPGPHVICRACRDVFLDPVVAHDGFTYCRGCAPNDFDAALSAARGEALGVDSLAADLVARECVAALCVLCKHGLRYVDSATGVGRWTHEPGGCAATVPMSERRAHEDACGFARSRCALPFGALSLGGGDDGDADSCPRVVCRHERAKHRASCAYRLVPCSIPGCGELVRQNRMARHVAVCDKKIATCPNGCPWRGRAGELPRHRATCALEVVACGREDTELGVGGDEQRERCAYRGERRLAAAHDERCPFRGVACRHCDALVSARRLLEHERVCTERRVTCDTCGDSVLERKRAAHVETECHKSDKSAFTRCGYHRFGCAFSGSPAALRAHAEEDAVKHLRLVALAVEASAVSYDAWYGEVNAVRDEVARATARAARDVDAVAAESRRVADVSRAETATRDDALADLRAFYETELEKVRVSAKRARAFSEARVRAVVAENAALRDLLASKLAKEAASAAAAEIAEGVARCRAATEAAEAEAEKRAAQWAQDVARIETSVGEAKTAVARGTAELERRLEAHERADGERVVRVERELREHVVECVGDLDEVAARQRALERRWREANKKLNPRVSAETRGSAIDQAARSRWTATRAADGARYRGETEAKETREGDEALSDPDPDPDSDPKPRVKGSTRVKKPEATKGVSGPNAAERQRGVHAAELLFGRGSRADPNVRSRKP